MNILANTLMTATRTEAIMPAPPRPISVLNWFAKHLKAWEDHVKFKKIDQHMMEDAGLTARDVDAMTYQDFLR